MGFQGAAQNLLQLMLKHLPRRKPPLGWWQAAPYKAISGENLQHKPLPSWMHLLFH